MTINTKKTNSKRNRRGAALVEFAVCLPVLVLIILGSIEATSAIFVRQSLTVSAYEGIRQAIRHDGSSAAAVAKAEEVLTQRSIRSYTIQLTPPDPTTVARGDEIAITISASIQQNSPLFGRVIQDRNIVVSTTMVRE